MHAAGRVLARVLAVGFLVAALASCGGKDDQSDVAASKPVQGQAKARSKRPLPEEDRMATAVSVGKTDSIVALQYDLLTRPAAGQPLEIELAVTPQSPADALEVEAHGMKGLDVVSGGSAAFQNVVAAQAYKARLLVQPAADGMYYLSVTTKLTSKVQSESATFSVPVVVAPVSETAKPAAAAGSSASSGAQASSGAEAAAKPAAAGD